MNFLRLTGKVHSGQMDEATRTIWQKELRRNRSKTLIALSRHWNNVGGIEPIIAEKASAR